jgi:hypothetical protein
MISSDLTPYSLFIFFLFIQAIEQGNMEGARIYAQNAIRQKNQALNYLRFNFYFTSSNLLLSFLKCFVLCTEQKMNEEGEVPFVSISSC